MSLIFDIDKEKSVAMVVETTGIDNPEKLDFTFTITVGNVKYGFPCKLKEDKVEINIPSLSTVISGVKSGKYTASLDVTGDKNYFLQPFNEQIELKREPKVEVIVDDNGEDVTVVEAIKASISKIIDLDTETPDESDTLDTPDVIDESDTPDVIDEKVVVVEKSLIGKMFDK